MHHVRLAALLALLVAGCSKPNDLAHLQEEAATLPAYYVPQVAALDQRADADQKSLRGQSEAPVALLDAARGRLGQLDGMPAQLATDLKQPATAQSPAALRALIDKNEVDYELGLREANTKLTSVEAWIDRKASAKSPPATSANPIAPPPASGVIEGAGPAPIATPPPAPPPTP